MPERNWAGNYTYRATTLRRPESVDELQTLVRESRRLKVLGTRHSFNDVADSDPDGTLVSLERLAPVFELDAARRTVTIDGGATYGRLCRSLAGTGFALHNLASLPHISVAGACATATHGSGDRNANLATAVRAMEIVTGDGEIVALDRERDGERFRGAVVGLGALGVVTRLTLDLQPAFDVRQDVFEGLPLDRLEGRFDELTSSGYSVSLFTGWREPRIDQVWVKHRVADGAIPARVAELLGAAAATVERHPIAGLSAEHCTAQLGVPGPWHERLPHFRMDFTPSSGAELQTDYFVPRAQAWQALTAIAALREHVAPVLQVAEVRTVAADDLWMSPCYERDCVSFHYTGVDDWPAVRALLPQIEAPLAPLGARPHWGKLFTMAPAEVQAHYARLDDFRALAREMDHAGKFVNPFLRTYIGL
jgi:xylitol oxidase